MPMKVDKLSAELFKIESEGVDLTAEQKKSLEKKCNKMAKAIEDHIKSATVKVLIPALPVVTAAAPGNTIPQQVSSLPVGGIE